jgi:5-methylcytosine-specific restriction enzyme A
MPTKPPHFCLHPGCRTLTVETYCAEHAAAHVYVDRRGSARDRGYDNDWRRLRDRYLRTHPLCARCDAAGKTTPAEVVHHVVPIDAGGPRMDVDNLMPLCRACHEQVHGRRREG